MKHILPATLMVVLFISLNISCFAQLYNFDSLYENSSQFKVAMDNIRDTFDIFNHNEILNVTITSDFQNLIRRKLKDEYQPATLEIILFDSIIIRNEIKIKSRGEYRIQNCYFPPIMLNFPKKEAFFRQIQEFDKIKLVGNCRGGNIYDQYLILEYYIYKIYNILSPHSFRVRLLNVKYVDISGKKKPRESYAFVLEPVDQLARRLNGANYERQGISYSAVDRESFTMMGLFQLMVGNTDFSIPGMHNIKLLKVSDANHPNPIAIPYDFDYCGIINATYAIPSELLPIENVRQRYYMGPCREMFEYEEAFKVLREKRSQIESLFRNSEYLNKGVKGGSLSYIDEFYKIIDSKWNVNSIIVSDCRK